MARPRIKVELNRFDYIQEALSLIAVIFLIGFPLTHYNSLPETIPIHFDVHGKPDGFGNQNMVFGLPLLGMILYIGMTILNRYPHIFNYPAKITEENAARIYRKGTVILRWVKLVILSLFVYLSVNIVQIALGNDQELAGTALIVISSVFVTLMFISIFWMRK